METHEFQDKLASNVYIEAPETVDFKRRGKAEQDIEKAMHEAPTDEGWRHSYYLQFGDTDFRKENPYTYDAVAEFIASLLQKEREKVHESYNSDEAKWIAVGKSEAQQLPKDGELVSPRDVYFFENGEVKGKKQGKSEAFSLVRKLIEQEKTDYKKYIGESASIVPVLTNIISLLSTLEGK